MYSPSSKTRGIRENVCKERANQTKIINELFFRTKMQFFQDFQDLKGFDVLTAGKPFRD